MDNDKKHAPHLLLIGLLGCSLLVASCGQKGPLYIPADKADQPQEQEKAVDTNKKTN